VVVSKECVERAFANGSGKILFCMSEPEFIEIQLELEEPVSQLKGTRDRALRLMLLREMRRLMAEVDRVLESQK
jgi:hypothetical protein